MSTPENDKFPQAIPAGAIGCIHKDTLAMHIEKTEDLDPSALWSARRMMWDANYVPVFLAAPSTDGGWRTDALRYRWLRDQHEGQTGLQMDADGLPIPMEPTPCAFTVFMPDPDGIESLIPVGCIPGELDDAIDAAIDAAAPPLASTSVPVKGVA